MDQAKLQRGDAFLFGIAMLLLIAYIVLYPQIFPDASIKFSLTEEQISKRVNWILDELGYDTDRFVHHLNLRHSSDQIRYLQKQFGFKKTNAILKENVIPAYYWKVDLADKHAKKNMFRLSYDNDEQAQEEAKKALTDTISLQLSLNGRLLQLMVNLGENIKLDTTDYDHALNIATTLMQKVHGDGFASYRLVSPREESQISRSEFQFTWENDQPIYGETEKVKITVRGNRINQYRASFSPPKQLAIGSPRSELHGIPEVIVAIGVVILFIILLIKMLRRDEIELKNNMVLSIVIALAWMFQLITELPLNQSRLLLALLLSLFVTTPFIFIGFLLVSSISESSARAIWDEKLLTFDAFRKRTILFPQFSLSIFRGIAIALIAGGALALLTKAIDVFRIGYMDFPGNRLVAKFGWVPMFYVIAEGLRLTGFYEMVFRLFFVSTLRQKFNRNATIILLAGALSVFSYGAYSDLKISPYLINIVINFIIAAIFIIAFMKWDFMTAWIGAFCYYLMRELYPLIFQSNSYYFWNGIMLWLIFGALIAVGIIGYHRKISFEMVQKYIPSYVLRRQERERLQREFEIARRVQFSFLPRQKPKLDGIDLASICIPASEVGGDYYDFIEMDDQRLGVVIGDVSGKGISAAFHMTLTKGFLKSQARSVLSPRQVMINLNELFYENVERGTFISMIYGIFDMRAMTFSFARAGHNPLIIQKASNNKLELLCPRGLALGLAKGSVFERVIEQYSVPIQSQDIFVFYTDGFSEAMNDKKEEFGEERLQRLIQENSFSSAQRMIDFIKENVIQFVGDAPQHDDMTMLVVRIL
ncbi:MAG: PP2C family protein-serine/threonine phosphatase [candidate division KSB1 bacterium]|nr:PP2C family protein-serine/threonine phosphatase [candidate division KSB1 bacterium]